MARTCRDERRGCSRSSRSPDSAVCPFALRPGDRLPTRSTCRRNRAKGDLPQRLPKRDHLLPPGARSVKELTPGFEQFLRHAHLFGTELVIETAAQLLPERELARLRVEI